MVLYFFSDLDLVNVFTWNPALKAGSLTILGGRSKGQCTVPFKKTRFFGHLWSKMGWIHIEIKYLKSPNKILIFLLQIDMNQIFQMRYYMTFNDNLKQSYRPSKFAVKNFRSLSGTIAMLEEARGPSPILVNFEG